VTPINVLGLFETFCIFGYCQLSKCKCSLHCAYLFLRMNHKTLRFTAANKSMNFVTRTVQGKIVSWNAITDLNFLLWSFHC